MYNSFDNTVNKDVYITIYNTFVESDVYKKLFQKKVETHDDIYP